MKGESDYSRDLTEIRSMMERSSRFLSLSGLAGVMAGIYALAGAYIAYNSFGFKPHTIAGDTVETWNFNRVALLAIAVLLFALGTAILLSWKKANKRGERLWNATSRRVLVTMTVPLVTGGLFILILIWQGLVGLVAPCTLLFYGVALHSASKFTYEEMKFLGLINIALGLIGACFIEYAVVCWAFGFGVLHIVYGIYLHYKYER